MPDDYTNEQLDDLGELLARTVIPGNILTLAKSVLGDEGAHDAANDFGNVAVFARRVVESIHKAGRIPETVALLLQGTNPNSYLTYNLNRILLGGRLDDDKAHQAFVNRYEPFLSSDMFRKKFPRIMRTVCAIGLGTGVNKLLGTGFLVGPDLVMTNFHVLQRYLKVGADGTIQENGDGDQIFCFFDYFSEPGPRFPPVNGKHSFLVVPAVKDSWLVKGSVLLPNDGIDDHDAAAAKGKYDYAVIQLSRKVGNLPSQQSGGGARGWLTLPSKVDMFEGRRVIVYQHPGESPQQFDVGDYKQLDTSRTRVRYTVSTAKGSSGGAAVDSEGQLFALHVAEVMNPALPGVEQMNQGVLITLIADDLKDTPRWSPQPPPDDQPMSFWSLTDDLANPQPIIGRGTFRDHVYEMSTSPKPRVMVVWGPAGSGVRYSMRLLERILGAQTPIVPFSQKDLSTKTPRDFVRSLLGALGISGVDVPTQKPTEDVPRFLRELTRWLAARLAEDEQKKRIRYPAWIVLNTVMPPGERFEWAESLNDFIAALAGVHDIDQEEVEVQQLRLLFLTSNPASLPLTGIQRKDEDLAQDTNYIDGFIECLRRALHAIDKEKDFGGVPFFEGQASKELQSNPASPPRQVLSELARDYIFYASKP